MVVNMSVHVTARSTRPTLLDVAAEVLVADPSASLADVAAAASIGRTTLHKQYATRDDLLRAVAHRSIDLWSAAIDDVDRRCRRRAAVARRGDDSDRSAARVPLAQPDLRPCAGDHRTLGRGRGARQGHRPARTGPWRHSHGRTAMVVAAIAVLDRLRRVGVDPVGSSRAAGGYRPRPRRRTCVALARTGRR